MNYIVLAMRKIHFIDALLISLVDAMPTRSFLWTSIGRSLKDNDIRTTVASADYNVSLYTSFIIFLN